MFVDVVVVVVVVVVVGQTGDEVVVSTTGFNAWETETRLLTAVSADGLTLTLNRSLEFTHVGTAPSK